MTMTETRDMSRDTPVTPPEPLTLEDLPPAQRRERAQELWRESGGTLKAPAAAERYGCSERWWRNQINAARGTAGNGTTPPVPRHNGTAPPAVPRHNGNGTGGVPRDMPRKVNGTAKRTDPPAPRHAPAARRRNTGTGSRAVTVLAVVVVAAVAAVASFDHQRELAVMAGEGWRAWLLPLSVDGLVVAATMVMLDRRRAGQPAGALPWLSLVLGVAASLAANVAAAEPTVAGRLVAAWPPVALLLAFELLLRHVDGRRR